MHSALETPLLPPENGIMRLYVDGEEIGSMAKTGALDTDTTKIVSIGANAFPAVYEPFDGLIDDVRIYNKALNLIQIKTLVGMTWKRWGTSLELPSMPGLVQGHSFVYHKGDLYRIGGSANDSYSGAVDSIYKFDFSTNAWSTLVRGTHFIDPDSRLRRFRPGVCSWGDEIFVFGGQKSDNSVVSDATAYNPATKMVRPLKAIPTTLNYAATPGNRWKAVTAVPCGQAIYLIGGCDATGNGGCQILKYTP